MKRLAILFGILALSVGCDETTDTTPTKPSQAPATTSAAPAPEQKVEQGVKFAKLVPKVGQKADVTQVMDLKLKVSALGKTAEFGEVSKETRKEEVLEVTEGVVTKLKVSYADKSKVETEDGKEKPDKVKKLSGRTFVLGLKGDKVEVLDEKEKAVPKADADIIAKGFREKLGKPDKVAEKMPTRALKVGDKVPELAEAVKALLQEDPKEQIEAEEVSAIFKGKDGKNGAFDVTVVFRAKQGSIDMRLELRGKVLVDVASSRVASVQLEGPVTLGAKAENSGADDASGDGKDGNKDDAKKAASKKKGSEIDGTGTVKMSLTASYS